MIIHPPSKKENKNDAGLNISNQSASSPQVCFCFLFDPVHPSAFCLSRKYTLHIKNFPFSPPPPPPTPSHFNPPGNSGMTLLTIIHYTTKNMTLSPSIYPLKEEDSSAFLYNYSYNIFSSNIMLIPSLPNKKVGHFQLGTLSC